MKKLPHRSYSLVFAFFMAGCMTCLVSLISTVISIGISAALFKVWMSSWAASFLFAFPVTVLVVPIVRNITDRLVESG